MEQTLQFASGENPFRSAIQMEDSSYYGIKDNKLMNFLNGKKAPAIVTHIHDSLKGMCSHPAYSCPLAKKVFDKGLERLLVYPSMAECNIGAVAHDLYEYIKEYVGGEEGNDLTAMICFIESDANDTFEFQNRLWLFLSRLSKKQQEYFVWPEKYSSKIADKNFSFCFAGIPIFIAAFFKDSTRTSRRFVTPALILNPHEQFDRMKREGKYPSYQRTVINREIDLQGCTNPVLSDFESDEGVEWIQYVSDPNGKCPIKDLLSDESTEIKNNEIITTNSIVHGGCPYKHI